MAHRVTREEGLLIGGSGGTAVAAALQVAKDLTANDLVVAIVPDSGRGYLSKVFDDAWMATMGFSRADGTVIGDLLTARDDELPELIYVSPEDSVRDAALLMRKYGVSQIAVAKGDMPLSAAEVIGSVSELWLMNQTYRSDEILDRPIEEVVQDPLPTIGAGEPINRAVSLLEQAPALLVLDGGRPRTIVSRTDLLGFLSPDAGNDL